MIKTNEKLTQEVEELKSQIRKIYLLTGHTIPIEPMKPKERSYGVESLRAAADAKKVQAMTKPISPMTKKALNEKSDEATRT